jgi:hypothetical protein
MQSPLSVVLIVLLIAGFVGFLIVLGFAASWLHNRFLFREDSRRAGRGFEVKHTPKEHQS